MPDHPSEAARCPVCESGNTERFLARFQVPVHQNLVMPTAAAAREIARGDLVMVVCQECGFVFNSAFDLGCLSYGASYDNNQTHSGLFQAHVDSLARQIIGEQKGQSCRIVDVGCGNGDFLRRLLKLSGSGTTGYGFDPAYTGPEIDCGGSARFVRDYYGPECAELSADVIVCRHVIEHVPKPVELLRTVRQALVNSPHARVYFETPDVSWIFRNQVIWDFFYEHCSLFTAQSLTTAFQRAGFPVSEVRNVFGGQYLWLEATVAQEAPVVTRDSEPTLAQARDYAVHDADMRADWSATLCGLREKGKVALWGAGAKGVTFANLIDPDQSQIDCVVDINPSKQGHFLPGTGHPIVNFDELPARNVASAVVMNPNYCAENRELLRANNIFLELIAR